MYINKNPPPLFFGVIKLKWAERIFETFNLQVVAVCSNLSPIK
jgi:hypothetical protein